MNKNDREKQEQADKAAQIVREVLVPEMVPVSIQQYIKELEAKLAAQREQIERLLAEAAHS